MRCTYCGGNAEYIVDGDSCCGQCYKSKMDMREKILKECRASIRRSLE